MKSRGQMKMCKSMLRKRSSAAQFVFMFALGLTPFFGGFSYAASSTSTGSAWDQLPTILSRIVPPSFRDEDFVITNYGAVGDGAGDCNAAFKKAIAACTKAGGGRVVVPKGTFLTNGPIHLDNNVNLHISEGATIKFGTDFDDYLPHVFVRWEGTECYSYSPFIYAYKKINIAVTGPGTLDGQARDTWARWPDKSKPGTMSNEELREVGGRTGDDFVPVEERIFYGKPSLIQPVDCKNVLIEGFDIRDYPWWCIHLTYCTNATVRNVTVVDGSNPNNDGCDVDSCTDVLIENCGFNTRDDSFCVKAGRDQDAWRVGRPSKNIVLRNMKDWKGPAIGSEMSGGAENIFMYDCEYDGRVMYLKSNLDRGGYIKDVYVKNIKVGSGYLLNLRNNYHGYRGGNFPTEIRNIHIEDVTIEETGEGAVSILGIPKAPVSDVFLKNITVNKAKMPFVKMQYAENVVLENVRVNSKLQPAHPKHRLVAPGSGYITAIRDGNWSDGSIWDVWKMDGKPDGRIPSSKDHGRVMIGGGEFVPKDGVTVTVDMDIDEIFELRIYRDATLIIPSGTTFKVAKFRPDRTNSVVRQTGGTSIIDSLNINDVTCQYFITGGTVKVNNFNLGEGSLIIDDSSAAIVSISVANALRTGAGTTTKFIAHKNGIAPVQCKDVQLDGEKIIVDVTRYDYAANGDLVLISYTGSGPEKPGSQEVTIIGGKAELVYDDAAKQIKLTNFGQGGIKARISENER